MIVRTRLLITALFLCHQVLGAGLVTTRLLAEDSTNSPNTETPQATATSPATTETVPNCAGRAMTQLNDGTIICAVEQEKVGDVYKLHGDAEIHYRSYVLRADEVTYDSDSGEATGTGHFRLDGGPNDDHIRASHGNYNLTAETGRFYDVTATTGFRFHGNRLILTSTAPFSFSGKEVAKTDSEHYYVYQGTITTCELPHPKWRFDARKVAVDVGGNASIYHSAFFLRGVPIFYFPYATHPVAKEVRHTGFLMPTAGRSSSKGNIVGEAFYWAINRSNDMTIGAEYFSTRGWSQRGEYRARPSDSSYVDFNFFGVNDRGTVIGTPTGPQVLKEGGQEARLNAEGNFYGYRAVANIDYLSSFLFRLAFSDSFAQAVNSEVKSQAFLSKSVHSLSLNIMVERYQNFFQQVNPNGSLSNPPVFDAIQFLHTPSFNVSSADQQIKRWPVFWSLDASVAGLSRSQPGFHTGDLVGRFDLNPEMSMPLLFHGWSLRPGIAVHETYYSKRLVNGVAVDDPTNRQALEADVELRPPALERVFEREFFGQKWKHVIEPRAVYRLVTGVNDFPNVIRFDERDILSDTNEVEYGIVTRLYAKRPPLKIEECETPMTGLAVGAAAPEQTVPWQRTNTLGNGTCTPGPRTREVATWELKQKYFLDPTFGGAVVSGQRNVFTTTEELTGIAFVTQPRHLSPLFSRLRAATSSRTDTEWDLDYDFQLNRVNASALLLNLNAGPFTLGGGDAFLQIPQLPSQTLTTSQNLGVCTPITPKSTQSTCKFQQFRVALGYGGLGRRGFSAATSFGLDAETKQLQFATAETTYNWDCCGLTLEYRRYAIANVRNENLYRFTFSLANIGGFGNLRRQERLY